MRAPVLLTSLLIGTVCMLAYYLPSAPPHGQYAAAPCRGVVPAKTCGGKFANLNELHTSQSVTIAAGIDHIAILGRHDEQVQQIVTQIRSILVEHHAQIKGNEQELEAAACACGEDTFFSPFVFLGKEASLTFRGGGIGGMTEKDTTVLYRIGELLGRIERLIVQVSKTLAFNYLR